VDVEGRRLVLTTLERDASADDRAELESILASIEIQAGPTQPAVPATVFIPNGSLPVGRYPLTVAGVALSIAVSEENGDGNTGWGSNGAFYVSRDIKGSQGAEAAILWTSFPDGPYPLPCFDILPRSAGSSAGDLAAAVAAAPPVADSSTGPLDVTVGGLPAKYVSFIVGEDRGCDPGFFFRWPARYGGALWGPARTGDTISVWIVDVQGVLLVIEGMSTTEADAALRAELQMFIDSIEFE
jgi:hypothetical protein